VQRRVPLVDVLLGVQDPVEGQGLQLARLRCRQSHHAVGAQHRQHRLHEERLGHQLRRGEERLEKQEGHAGVRWRVRIECRVGERAAAWGARVVRSKDSARGSDEGERD
jgi:hypothetical protein